MDLSLLSIAKLSWEQYTEEKGKMLLISIFSLKILHSFYGSREEFLDSYLLLLVLHMLCMDHRSED